MVNVESMRYDNYVRPHRLTADKERSPLLEGFHSDFVTFRLLITHVASVD